MFRSVHSLVLSFDKMGSQLDWLLDDDDSCFVSFLGISMSE